MRLGVRAFGGSDAACVGMYDTIHATHTAPYHFHSAVPWCTTTLSDYDLIQ